MPDTTTYSTLKILASVSPIFKLRTRYRDLFTYNEVLPPSGKEKNLPVAGADEWFSA